MEKIAKIKLTGLVLGPLFFALISLFPAPEGLGPHAWTTVACASLIVTWWLFEALPIPITSLIPLVAFPLLNITTMKEAAVPYSNPIIFLYLGGFMIALAMERWNLHLRISLHIIRFVGTNADRLVLGFMLATGFLSMWISNTATTMMMLPIAMSVIDLLVGDKDYTQSGHAVNYEKFFTVLMLGIAYAATIGGLGTLVGTPPNLIFAGFIRDTYHMEIKFLDWALIGTPLAVFLLIVTWVLLTKCLFRNHLGQLHGGEELIAKELEALGPMSRGEKRVSAIFLLTALLWMFSPYLAKWLPLGDINENNIAILSALLLFITPVDLKKGIFVLDWKTAEKMPWGILMLFGGGLSLADALGNTGVIQWIGSVMAHLDGIGIFAIILVIAASVTLMSEFMSNMALTAVFLPVAAALAIGFHENPLLITIPVTLAASAGFMLPMATPPNAIVFASGHVTVPRMVRAGFFLDIIAVLAIALFAWLVIPYVFNITPGVLPEWAIPVFKQ